MSELERYVATLPQGLESFPEFCCKGSLLRELVDLRDLPQETVEALPPALKVYFEVPPLVSSWYPEVHLVGVMLAHFEPRFGGDRAAFVQWFYDLSKALYEKPLYRILMALGSPERLVGIVAKAWGAFHRGAKLRKTASAPGLAVVEIGMPEMVYPDLIAPTTAQAFLAAVESAGGRNPRVECDRLGPEGFRLTMSWD